MRPSRLLTALAVLPLSGCISYSPVQITDTSSPIADLAAALPLGRTEGTSCSHFVLGFSSYVEPPVHHASVAAREAVGADALVGVTVDAHELNLLLYSQSCVTVRGLGVRLRR